MNAEKKGETGKLDKSTSVYAAEVRKTIAAADVVIEVPFHLFNLDFIQFAEEILLQNIFFVNKFWEKFSKFISRFWTLATRSAPAALQSNSRLFLVENVSFCFSIR